MIDDECERDLHSLDERLDARNDLEQDRIGRVEKLEGQCRHRDGSLTDDRQDCGKVLDQKQYLRSESGHGFFLERGSECQQHEQEHCHAAQGIDERVIQFHG
jgi:hypothetical protein